MNENWMSAPTVNGLYWAYKEGRTNEGPTVCDVKLAEMGRWRVKFVTGRDTYTFEEGRGWLWKLAAAPDAPAKKAVRA